MCIAPSGKGSDNEISNTLCNFSVVLGRFFHFCSNSIVGLWNYQLVIMPVWNSTPDLANTGSIVSREAASYLVRRNSYLTQAHSIYIFSLSSHPRNREHLLILRHALLELAKEDAETCHKLSVVHVHCGSFILPPA